MFYKINSAVSAFVWGPPMLAVFLATGLFLSFRSGFYQITHIGDWMRSTVFSLFGKRGEKDCAEGSISQLGALTSALAACLGTGNIVGVAAALCSGGAGSLFWMCVSAVIGMMTCCCENILGVKYRVKDEKGNFKGGPMYYIERGLGMKGLAVAYAVLLTGASLGMGNMTQANSVAQGLSVFGVPPAISGILLAAAVAVAVSGGLKRISAISEKLIPVLSAAFVVACFIIIGKNIENLIPSLKSVIREAFTVRAVSGYSMAKAMRYGISRGVFSNEAGLGSSAIIHAAADCKNPAEQGKWGILEVFIDTVLMCTVTGAAILVSGKWSPQTELNGVELCAAVFESVFGKAGGYFLSISICLFAFATLIAWSYYGKSGVEYIFGGKSGKTYNLFYVAAAFAGSIMRFDGVWNLSDTFNGLMAMPNIFSLFLLSKEAVGLLRENTESLNGGRVRFANRLTRKINLG